MLHLYLATLEELIARDDFIRYPNDYFEGVWEPEWLSDPFGRAVIETIDKVPLGEDVERSLLEFGMRVEDLCTGTKNLLLCRHLDKMNRMTMMGENCYPFLLDAADEKDITMGVTAYFLIRAGNKVGPAPCNSPPLGICIPGAAPRGNCVALMPCGA